MIIVQELKKVGSLIQNQEFPIVNISGNWIKVKYLGTDRLYSQGLC